MKNLIILFILFIGLTFFSCKNGTPTEESTKTSEPVEQVDKSGIEYTSAYICPMHCKDSGSTHEGVCPTCGMDYVVNKNKHDDHSGHDHSGHDHSGHDHGDHSGHNH